MSSSRSLAASALLASTLACSVAPDGGPGGAAVSTPARRVASDTAANPLRHVAGEMLVRFRGAPPAATRASTLSAVRGRLKREYRSAPGLALIEVEPGVELRHALSRLRRDPAVLYAEPNYVVQASRTSADPRFAEQWGLASAYVPDVDINAPGAWDVTVGSSDVVVAVLDSGVDYDHPDLAPNVWRNPLDCDADGADDDGDGYADDCHGIDVVDDDADPMDVDGHGTHVAGILGAVGDDGAGVAGVSWRTSIVACRFLDASGDGSIAGAIACLDYVAALKDHGVNVVATNNSWGGGDFSQALSDAIAAQRRRGILFVTAAGNDGAIADRTLPQPCSDPSPNVICVGAITERDMLAPFSARGLQTVHLAAPGTAILSTLPVSQGGYGYLDGTSMAAPFVTGTAALIRAARPNDDWRAVKNRILSTVVPDPIRTTVTGGHLDAQAALTCEHAPMTRRLRPIGSSQLVAVGARIGLSVLNLDCAAPAGPVVVAVSPTGEQVVLRDDGTGGDVEPGDGVYGATWTAAAGGTFDLTFPGGDVYRVVVDPDLQPGFPRKVWAGGGAYRGGAAISALVGDIDDQPDLEILFTGLAAGPLYAFKADGAPAAGWPALDDHAVAVYPSLARLQGGSSGRQVVAVLDEQRWPAWTMVAYDGAGRRIANWDRGASNVVPPLVADVNADGLEEVISGYQLVRADGTPEPGVSFGDEGLRLPALGDLFGDGRLEVVDRTVFRLDGTVIPGYPPLTQLYGFAGEDHTAVGSAIGDVDGDGEPEIVTTHAVYGADWLLRHELPVPAWASGPALADLDGDGALEIVIQAENPGGLYVFRGDGSAFPGWPLIWDDELGYSHTQLGNSAPTVGDVDGDGLPEIVVTTYQLGSMTTGDLRVYRRDGTLLPRFPKVLAIARGSVPALADIDLDGRNEIVVVGDPWDGYSGFVDRLFVFDLGGPQHGPVLWGQYRGNAQRTASVAVAHPHPRSYHALTVTTTGFGRLTSAPFNIDCAPYPLAGSKCTRRVSSGTSVTLTATPGNTGYIVGSWSGACSGAAPDCTVLVDADTVVGVEFVRLPRQLTVSRAGNGHGSVTSSPSGIDCGSTCSFTFRDGDRVFLYAGAAPDSVFTGWSGDCVGDGTCSVILDRDASEVATFTLRKYTLGVTLAGGGDGTVTAGPAGISCGVVCSATLDAGTIVTLTASAGSDSRFAGWSGACSGTSPTCVLTATGDLSSSARFDRVQHTLAVARSGTGGGAVHSGPAGIDCGASCSFDFDAGTSVTLTATPDATSAFSGWSGACSGAGACVLSMTGAQSVTAQFTRLQHPIAVSRSGGGAGTVTSSPAGVHCGTTCGASFDAGTAVTLTATAEAGSTFAGWTGDCAGTSSRCVLIAAAARTADARFDLEPVPRHSLVVSRTGTGAGTVSSSPAGITCGDLCAAEFAHGTAVTLTALAASGSTFAGWTGDCVGAGITCPVSMTAARAVTARFDLVPGQRRVTVHRAGTGAGTVTSSPAGVACGATCAASFPEGWSVTLSATAASGSTFTGWTGACGGTGTCPLTLTTDAEVTATFAAAGEGGGEGGGTGGGGGGGGGCSTGAGSSLLGALALVLLRRRRTIRARPR